MQDFEHQIVLTTCGDIEQATQIAETLVREALAACVNIVPAMRSVYRWQNKIEVDEEVLLLIKSARGLYGAIERRINELHSYELPEIVAVPIVTGSNKYLQWINEQVAVR
jgi:periplasmic divalent cation tolerance protein